MENIAFVQLYYSIFDIENHTEVYSCEEDYYISDIDIFIDLGQFYANSNFSEETIVLDFYYKEDLLDEDFKKIQLFIPNQNFNQWIDGTNNNFDFHFKNIKIESFYFEISNTDENISSRISYPLTINFKVRKKEVEE